MQLTAVDIFYLILELKAIEDSKIEQFYQYSQKEFLIKTHNPKTKEKKEIKITVPVSLYYTQYRPEAKIAQLPSFCVYIRKYLVGGTIKRVFQPSFNRIVGFEVVSKQIHYFVYIELYDKGNMIVCDDTQTILTVAELQKWTSRSILPRQPYVIPDISRPDSLSFAQLEALTTSQQNETISKFLATKCHLGGVGAQLACELTQMDSHIKVSDVSIETLHSMLRILFTQTVGAKVVDNKLIPFGGDLSISSVLDIAPKVIKKISKKEKMVLAQLKQKEKFEKEIAQSSKKAEHIYHNYEQLQQLIQLVLEKQKKMSPKEFQSFIKEHKHLVSYNPQTKELVIDI